MMKNGLAAVQTRTTHVLPEKFGGSGLPWNPRNRECPPGLDTPLSPHPRTILIDIHCPFRLTPHEVCAIYSSFRSQALCWYTFQSCVAFKVLPLVLWKFAGVYCACALLLWWWQHVLWSIISSKIASECFHPERGPLYDRSRGPSSILGATTFSEK
jgi:hypothetical protein